MAKRKDQDPEHSQDQVITKKIKQQHAGPEPRSDTHVAQQLVVDLNARDAESFQSDFIPLSLLKYTSSGGQCYELTFKESADLEPAELNACFNLIETTSRADYEPSSFGWHPTRKRTEMMEDDMRYLLVRRQDVSPTIEKHGKTRIDTSIEGFLSFQICHDSTPLVPVLYIYEIHLAESLRGVGLGAHLMQLAEDVACRTGVQKTMLTVFVCNAKALSFYRSRGYAVDPSSPGDRRTRNKVVKTDHHIMSRSVTKKATGREADAGESA